MAEKLMDARISVFDWSTSGIKLCLVSAFPPTRGLLSEYTEALVGELEKQESIQGIDILSTVEDRPAGGGKTRIHSTWRKDSLFAPLMILRQVIMLRPNIVHFNLALAVFGKSRVANFSGFLSVFLVKILGRLMDWKTVLTLHNLPDCVKLETAGLRNTLLMRTGFLLAVKLATKADCTVVTMRSYVTIINRRYEGRAVFIPHGAWFTEADPTLESNGGDILYIGYIAPYKDIRALTEAYYGVKGQLPGVRLIIAGTTHPNYLKDFEALKCHIEQDGILYLGYVPDEQVPNLVMGAYLIVLPYRTCTGTSGIVHFVSTFGRPIIATDLPEFRELRQEGCGLVLTELDPQRMAEEILRLYNDKHLWQTLARRNIEFSKDRTWSNIAKKYLELYRECLRKEA